MRSLTSAGVGTTTGVDPATTTIKTMWDAWIDERDDLEAVFISPQDPLGQRGNIFDDEPLRDYLASKLEQTMPRTSRSSESHARTHSVEGKHSHSESGTWKKLGISSWGSSIGLGSGESVSADQTKGTVGSSNSNLNTNSTKWGGIGQWFGIGSGTPPTRSSHQETSRQKSGDTRVETDTGLGGTDRVDLASLHSALETEAGGQEDGDRPDWTIEEVWVDRGTERVTLAYVIVSPVGSPCRAIRTRTSSDPIQPGWLGLLPVERRSSASDCPARPRYIEHAQPPIHITPD